MAHPRNGAQHPATGGTTPVTAERPLSFYDNLSSSAIVNGAPGRVIQFPDIQFRFDENIPDRRSVHSSAKSDFFGLLNNAPHVDPLDSTDRRLPAPTENPATLRPSSPPSPPLPPATQSSANNDGGASTSASPTSTASTVPAQSRSLSPSSVAGSPRDSYAAEPPGTTSTPRSSRPSSTIKTITIKLPDSGVGPSEAVYMTTTVPQNFTKNSNTLIGRHKPTRNSLRHSRMLVVNKSVPQRYPRGNSLNLRHVRLSKVLMVLQILTGLALSLIGLAITIWSPSIQTKDNPYWSGIMLILCGSMFLILFEFKRGRTLSAKSTTHQQHQPHQQHQSPQVRRWRENCFQFLHVNAIFVLLLTIFFTMLAFIYALIHTTNLSSAGLRCESQFPFNVNSSTCVCTIDTTVMENAGSYVSPLGHNETNLGFTNATNGVGSPSGDNRMTKAVIRMEYRDFSCGEVHGIWYYVTITSTLLNSAGCLLAATFLVIYAVECIRRTEHSAERSLVTTRTPCESQTAQMITTTTNVGTTQSTAAEDQRGVPADASSVPLLRNVPILQPSATIETSAPNASVVSGTSSPMSAFLTEENTLTTIVSEELEAELDASS